MKFQTEDICFRKSITCIKDGESAAEAGIRCGEIYLFEQ